MLQRNNKAKGVRACQHWLGYVALCLVGMITAPHVSHAQGVYYSTQSVLKDFFKTSQRVTFVTLDNKDNVEKSMTTLLGYRPTKARYVVFVAYSGDTIDGYAVIDDEQGQHQPITFAVKLTPEGDVERSEVMVYREGYGDEIREIRFRRQFVGKAVEDPTAFGKDIVAISGATISSRAMSIAVRRAIALVHVARLHGMPNTQALSASAVSQHRQ